MDLSTVEAIISPSSRQDLADFRDGDGFLAGGTWLFSEPQDHLRRLIDLTVLDWPAVTVTDDGIELAATARLSQIYELPGQLADREWPAAILFKQCCDALLASFKIWNTATIGGNLCLSFTAGAMISLVAALEGTVLVWTADGGEYSLPVFDFVTGNCHNVLGRGDLVRSVFLPAASLASRTAFRKLALSDLGRSGAVVAGRVHGDQVVLTFTAACNRPYRVVVDSSAGPGDIADAVDAVVAGDWTDDVHGAADWRRAVSIVMAAEIVEELHPLLPQDL